MTLSEGKDCRVYDGLEYKEEVGGEVDSKDGVGVDIRVCVRTAQSLIKVTLKLYTLYDAWKSTESKQQVTAN